MSNRQRLVLLGLAVLVAVVAVIVVGTGGDDETTTPQGPVPTLEVRDGEPVGGVRHLRFTKGEDIVFVVRSDAATEVHLHGYDVAKEIEAGGSVRYDVPADIDGSFELEVEDTGTLVAEIEVTP